MRWRVIAAAAAALGCAVGAQLGRIENRLEVSYDGAFVTAASASSAARLAVGERQFTGVSFAGHRSMVSETVLCRLSLQAATGQERVVVSGWVLQLLGRVWAGNCLRSAAPGFAPSFGDWTMDSGAGETLTLSGVGELPAPFTIRAETTGRGATVLQLDGERVVRVAIRDGFIDNDLSIELEGGDGVGRDRQMPPGENLRRIAGQLAEVGVVAALLMLAASLWSGSDGGGEARAPAARCLWWAVAVGVLALVHGGTCLLFARDVLGGVPHIPDSAYYVRQARAIAATRGTTLALPFDGDVADAVTPPFAQSDSGEVRLGFYERGWALLLAPFAAVDRAYLLNPLLSAVALVLLSVLARRLFDENVALVAAVFWAASPFSIIMAGDQMNHTGTACLLLAATLAAAGKRRGWLLVGGVFLGLAAWVRLLTTAALAAPAAAVVQQLRKGRRWSGSEVGALLCGAGIVAGVIVLDNLATTGHPLHFPRQVYHGLGFGSANLPVGLENADSMLAGLFPIVWGGPWPHLFLALALAGALLAPWRRSLALAAAPVSLVTAYAFTNAGGLHGYGPRFYFEAMPWVCILAALAATALAQRRTALGRSGIVAAGGVLLILDVFALAAVLPRYQDYNGMREAPAQAAAVLPRGTWLLVPASAWQRYEELATVFDPTFDELVVVRELPGITPLRLALLRPGWAVYRGTESGVNVVRTARGGMRAPPRS